MTILKADGFTHYSGAGMANLKTGLQQIMEDVELSVKMGWPGIDCKITQPPDKNGWDITLSKFSGNLIYYQSQFLTMQAIHGFVGKDFGLYLITEVITGMVKKLEAACQQGQPNQAPSNDSEILKYKYIDWIPFGNEKEPSKPKAGKLYQSGYSTNTTTMNTTTSYPAISSPNWGGLSGWKSKEPKVQAKSLKEVYENDNYGSKHPKVKKPKVKLTALETSNLKKQIAMGIPGSLTLAKAKSVHAKMSEKYGEKWLDQPVTEELQQYVKEVMIVVGVEAQFLPESVEVDKMLDALKTDFFKSDPMLEYLKSNEVGQAGVKGEKFQVNLDYEKILENPNKKSK